MENNYQGGEVNAFNAAKDIAVQRDLPVVLKVMHSFRQGRTGETPIKSLHLMTDEEKIFNKVAGLTQIIHSLRELIRLGLGRIELSCRNTFNAKKPENRGLFEEEENDFNQLVYYQNLLRACELDIREANNTKIRDDDFMTIKVNYEGKEEYDVTTNYFDMLDTLEETSSKIEQILHKHKIISRGLVEDEEVDYKAKEEEFIKRIVEA